MINKKWDELLKDEFKKPYFKQLGVFVKNEYGKKTVYPEYKNIFNAIKQDDQQLKEYAQVYIDRFANSFNRSGKRFTIEILYSKQVIGMYFKVIDESMFTDEVVFTSDNENLLPTITALTSQKLTDALFVQKDVRGFEKEYFYIFKPNEKRLWYKAIAYLDVNEFDDAMLRVGRNRE